MQIGEQSCHCDEGCDYRNRNCLGKICFLIEAFSQFDTVELSNICQGSYVTTHSVLNSNRLSVSFHGNDFIAECKKWLNYKAPNWSQPPRELYLNASLDLKDVKALLLGLISVGF